MSKCVVLIGPPCSGKSTIGKSLAYNTGYKYISSGDIARKMAEKDGSIEDLNAGNMAPEDMMREEIAKILGSDDDIILDGFPRFSDQYEWMINRFMHRTFAFIFIDAPILALSTRATSRGRSDDAAFDKRISYYNQNTVPMVNRINKDMAMHDGVTYITNSDAVHKVVKKVEDCLHDRGWI